MARTVHIIGAGLAGLSAAVELTLRGERVVVHEATTVAGGRCRSYHDQVARHDHRQRQSPAAVGQSRRAQRYLRAPRRRGPAGRPAEGRISVLRSRQQRAVDAAHQRRPLPWWIFKSGKRVPGTRALDYLPHGAAAVGAEATARSAKSCASPAPLYERLMRPLLLAALNIEPSAGSAALAGAVIRETLAPGGQACRPLIARDGLGSALIEPALALLRERNSAGAARASAASPARRRHAGRDARLRRRQDRARQRRRGHPRGAALRRRGAGRRVSRCRPNSAPSSTRISASTRRRTSRRSSG